MITQTTIKVILADDHPIYRDGIKSLLHNQPDMQLVAEAGNGKELLSLATVHEPDVILTDIMMPVMDGIEATREIIKLLPHTGIIALSMFNDDHFILDMLKAGALGYLLKDSHKADIVDAIKTVNSHQTYYCRSTSIKLARLIANNSFDAHAGPGSVSFTEREKDIMVLLCKELTSREISEKLHLSVRTVEGYRETILQKTGSRNIAGIIIYAMKHHLYLPE